jgi:hypothetical protein
MVLVAACRVLKWCIVAMVLGGFRGLAAAEPMEVMIGPGIRSHLGEPDPSPEQLARNAPGNGTVGALVAMLAYRLPNDFSAGVHGSVAWRSYSTVELGNMQSTSHQFRTIPVDIGVTVQYTTLGRLWVAPWAGAHVTFRRITRTYCYRVPSQDGPWPCKTDDPTRDWTATPSLGVTAGVNILCFDAHCVAGLVDILQTADGDYAAVSVGVAYHR